MGDNKLLNILVIIGIASGFGAGCRGNSVGRCVVNLPLGLRANIKTLPGREFGWGGTSVKR